MQELKHFKFGAVTIQTTTEQLSKAQEYLHATNGKNKDFGALRIAYLCTGQYTEVVLCVYVADISN